MQKAGPTLGLNRVGVIVLTQGTRPDDLQAALDSILSQRDVDVDVAVVGNGWRPTGLPAGVRGVGLAENAGIPAGRNAGVPHVEGDVLLFVDDDARLGAPDFLRRALDLLGERAEIGMIHPRVDATEGDPPARWVPRVRKGDRFASSAAFALWEGVVVIRRRVFEAAGGWGDEYFYAHEGIELAWRVWDAGYEVRYAGDLGCFHPPIQPSRHDDYYRLNARNRVWLARRNLRWPFSWLYVTTWTMVQLVRSVRSTQDRRALRVWFSGWSEGWRRDPGERRPLSWTTHLKMTRRGRPPFI